MKKELLLVFGTSADPIHSGHVQLIADAVAALARRDIRVCEVMMMPVFRHHNIRDAIKRSLPLTFQHRFEICELAATELKEKLPCKVSVSDLERQLVESKNRSNFTAETMEALREITDPDLFIGFLIGADSFSGDKPGFQHWYRWKDLLKSTTLVISPREGFLPNQNYLRQLGELGGNLVYLSELEVVSVSSSDLRARIVAGEDTEAMVEKGLLSPAVAKYIREKNLVEIWRQLDSQSVVQVINEEIFMQDPIEVQVGKLLFEKKLTLGLAESCTGGLIGHLLTNVPGSSEYFLGSIVSYAYQAKVKLLGVSWDTLRQYGAVSSETVIEMAQGARKAFDSDLALSVSCIAGPGGATASKPVGTSWLGFSTKDGDWSYQYQFEGSRVEVKEQLAHQALQILLDYLKNLD
ncbi:MAG: nicotinamide-nucleotide amidohydrolase family protein [Anaerolineaceae bacterium]|jgi:nicotinamide-nucleotide amidase